MRRGFRKATHVVNSKISGPADEHGRRLALLEHNHNAAVKALEGFSKHFIEYHQRLWALTNALKSLYPETGKMAHSLDAPQLRELNESAVSRMEQLRMLLDGPLQGIGIRIRDAKINIKKRDEAKSEMDHYQKKVKKLEETNKSAKLHENRQKHSQCQRTFSECGTTADDILQHLDKDMEAILNPTMSGMFKCQRQVADMVSSAMQQALQSLENALGGSPSKLFDNTTVGFNSSSKSLQSLKQTSASGSSMSLNSDNSGSVNEAQNSTTNTVVPIPTQSNDPFAEIMQEPDQSTNKSLQAASTESIASGTDTSVPPAAPPAPAPRQEVPEPKQKSPFDDDQSVPAPQHAVPTPSVSVASNVAQAPSSEVSAARVTPVPPVPTAPLTQTTIPENAESAPWPKEIDDSSPALVQACADWQGERAHDLAIKANALMLEVKADSSGWHEGRYQDMFGTFPSTFINRVSVDKIPVSRVAWAAYPYNADDASELSMKEEERFGVLEEGNSGWCLAMKSENGKLKFGYVPHAYLTDTVPESAKVKQPTQALNTAPQVAEQTSMRSLPQPKPVPQPRATPPVPPNNAPQAAAPAGNPPQAGPPGNLLSAIKQFDKTNLSAAPANNSAPSNSTQSAGNSRAAPAAPPAAGNPFLSQLKARQAAMGSHPQ